MADKPAAAAGEQWKIFDHLLDAVIIVDSEARLFYSNESFRHLCDSPSRAVTNHESAIRYIELPEECWNPLKAKADDQSDYGYREVGFITKNGTMGRAQVCTGRISIPDFQAEELFYIILRDVTVEARLHAKYKVQIENNERLIGELQRSLSETLFLRRLATELPIYSDTVSLLNLIAARMKTELAFRDAYFFYQTPDKNDELEPVGVDKRMGSRMREVVKHLAPALKEADSNQLVTSMVFRPFGMFWIAFFRPRLERAVVLIASAAPNAENVDHRTLLEALAGQVSTLLDNRALYFASITDPLTGLFNRRFFDSRFGIECLRATERRMPLSMIVVEVEGFKSIVETHGPQGADAVLNVLSQLIKRRIRTSDVVARVSPEEFAVLLPDTAPEDGNIVLESLKKQAADALVHVRGMTQPLNFTIACGITGFRWSTDTQQEVFKTADQALVLARADLLASMPVVTGSKVA